MSSENQGQLKNGSQQQVSAGRPRPRRPRRSQNFPKMPSTSLPVLQSGLQSPGQWSNLNGLQLCWKHNQHCKLGNTISSLENRYNELIFPSYQWRFQVNCDSSTIIHVLTSYVSNITIIFECVAYFLQSFHRKFCEIGVTAKHTPQDQNASLNRKVKEIW